VDRVAVGQRDNPKPLAQCGVETVMTDSTVWLNLMASRVRHSENTAGAITCNASTLTTSPAREMFLRPC
jgi:hypothetical protein